jgi:hypothetical protein
MLNEIWVLVGSSLILILAYILISNTLWLLFGSRLLQCLPGVNIKGISGTFKIAVMLILSAIGNLRWALKYIALASGKNMKPIFKEEVGKTIQQGARIIERRRKEQYLKKDG